MALQQRLESLKKRHAEIDLRLVAEEHRPAPDTDVLHRLKSQKLNLKDEIAKLLADERREAA